jgi:hypothetical protein
MLVAASLSLLVAGSKLVLLCGANLRHDAEWTRSCDPMQGIHESALPGKRMANDGIEIVEAWLPTLRNAVDRSRRKEYEIANPSLHNQVDQRSV